MNKNVTLPFVALIMVLAMVGATSAADTVDKVEVRGTVFDATLQVAAIQPNPAVWDSTNFAGFYYDADKDLKSETLTATITAPNVINKNDLIYTANRVETAYKNAEIGEYFVIGWFAEKYMAVNGNPDAMSKIILEMGSTDKKTLATDSPVELGNGYSLVAKQIDLDGNKVWLSLEKNGVEVESSIIEPNTMGGGDKFKECMAIAGPVGGIYTVITTKPETQNTFVYQKDIGSDKDVPIFSVYVDAVFRGTDTNLVQVKWAMLIDDTLVKVESGDEFGKLKESGSTGELNRLHSDEDITLSMDSDITIAENMKFYVADDKDAVAGDNFRYYPLIEYTITGDGVTPEPDVVATAEPEAEAPVVEAPAKPEAEAPAKPVVEAPAKPEAEAPAEAEEAPTEKPGVPGFEAVFAIAGLLAVAYLVLRQRE